MARPTDTLYVHEHRARHGHLTSGWLDVAKAWWKQPDDAYPVGVKAASPVRRRGPSAGEDAGVPAVNMTAPVALEPSGDVLPDFQFVGRATQADPAQSIKAVVVEVRHSDPRRAGRWTSGWTMVVPDPASGRFKIANPGQPALPPRQALRWRVRARARARVVSAWT